MNQSRLYTQRVDAIVFYLLLFYSTAFGTFCSQPLSHQYSIQCWNIIIILLLLYYYCYYYFIPYLYSTFSYMGIRSKVLYNFKSI